MRRSSRIVRLGPLVLKRYLRHRHAPEVSPPARVEREIVGSRLLCSERLTVAAPLWASTRLRLLLRQWHEGVHPRPPEGLTESEATALGEWIGEHRGRGTGIHLPGGNDLPLALTMERFDAALPAAYAAGRRCLAVGDLVHGDLRPGNLIRTERGLVVIDTEAVSVGCASWDVAHVIGLVTGLSSPVVPGLLDAARLTSLEAEAALALAGALGGGEAACA